MNYEIDIARRALAAKSKDVEIAREAIATLRARVAALGKGVRKTAFQQMKDGPCWCPFGPVGDYDLGIEKGIATKVEKLSDTLVHGEKCLGLRALLAGEPGAAESIEGYREMVGALAKVPGLKDLIESRGVDQRQATGSADAKTPPGEAGSTPAPSTTPASWEEVREVLEGVLLAASDREAMGDIEFDAVMDAGSVLLSRLPSEEPAPRQYPEVTAQMILDAGFNVFAFQLVLKSFLQKKDEHAELSFSYGGARWLVELDRRPAPSPKEAP